MGNIEVCMCGSKLMVSRLVSGRREGNQPGRPEWKKFSAAESVSGVFKFLDPFDI